MMSKAQFRKARYVTPDKTRIDLEIDHPTLGWIEITIDEREYPEVWKSVVATNPTFNSTLAEDYEATQLSIARQGLSADRARFCIALRNMGVIDQQWAIHAAQGNLPTALHGALVAGGLDISMEDAAIQWASLVVVPRHHLFVEAIRKQQNLTPIQMDELFL